MGIMFFLISVTSCSQFCILLGSSPFLSWKKFLKLVATLHALEIMGVRIERFRYVDYMGSVVDFIFLSWRVLALFLFPLF